jgi:hypothetical protein
MHATLGTKTRKLKSDQYGLVTLKRPNSPEGQGWTNVSTKKQSERRKYPCIINLTDKKDKVVPVLNQLSTTPCRPMGEWMYRSTFS